MEPFSANQALESHYSAPNSRLRQQLSPSREEHLAAKDVDALDGNKRNFTRMLICLCRHLEAAETNEQIVWFIHSQREIQFKNRWSGVKSSQPLLTLNRNWEVTNECAWTRLHVRANQAAHFMSPQRRRREPKGKQRNKPSRRRPWTPRRSKQN